MRRTPTIKRKKKGNGRLEMKTFKQIVEAMLKPKKIVDYEAHDDFGSPKKKVLARKSPSSSGGGGGNGGE